MSGRLQGHHAVVTGGAQGIGLAIARRFLHEGASVSLWDISDRQLQAAAQALDAPGRVFTAAADVRDETAILAAAQASAVALGPATVLVNNAGVLGPLVPTWEHSAAQWREVLDINLTGAFLCCRALVPQMLADLAGQRAPALGRRVVNIASVAGKEGNGLNAAYSASKAGLIALTKSLGKELAQTGVRVNCVTPAAVRTAIFAQMTQQHIDYMLSKIPMNRFGLPEEIAALVAWLASEDCSFSTGAVFDISGGRATY